MRNIFFLGIGGIGMSAIARYYKYEGYNVAGYDKTPSELTSKLEQEGIDIHYEDDINNIPQEYKSKDTFVIYTPAIPSDNKEFLYFLQNGNNPIKRSAVLGLIAKNKKVLAVAGTHGKTTTSMLLAHLMTQAADGCTAFLGGISKNYETNLLLSKNQWMVAEADEYDRSFLQLFPHIAIITASDADHLDIYGTEAEMKKSFGDFASQIEKDGILILKKGVEIPLNKVVCKIYSYSYNNTDADFYAFNIEAKNGIFTFDIHTPMGDICNCTLNLPGWVNIENAVAATAAALLSEITGKATTLSRVELNMASELFGVVDKNISSALASFLGVKRRFDIKLNNEKHVYIDDYAHHPEELTAAITSIRQMFPNRKMTGVFQPHLYTRTRDFADGFGKALSLLDELILLDIYPARELPIEGVTSQIIFDKVSIENKKLCTKDELVDILKQQNIDVLVTLGAGDIDRFVEPITELLK